MNTDSANNLKLGAFVVLGFILLVISLFYIGNRNSFTGSNIKLKARFSNINGLQEGNNVLFSGINAGTIKSIKLLNSKTIEVTMVMKKDIAHQIPINSKITIGTDGLMGNKLLNITPAETGEIMVQDGDYLVVEKTADIDQVLTSLLGSTDNIQVISKALKNVSLRIEQSEILSLMEKRELSENLQQSMFNIRMTTQNTQKLTLTLQKIVEDIHSGKGAAGLLLSNKAFADDLETTIQNLKQTSKAVNETSVQLKLTAASLNEDLQQGKGPLPVLLKDSLLSQKINASLENIEKGTYNFNLNMEALKHNFLFRGYFKKLEKENKDNTTQKTK
jgi:phospholipid/cholesterol/gamma-HCH transport system substrate-binding protein